MDNSTQASKVLKAIKNSGSRGFPNYKFPQMGILRYSARIGDLRREGHAIQAERQIINGKYTGIWFYRLSSEQVTPSKKFKPNPLIRELMIAKSKGRFGAYKYIDNRLKELV